MQSGCGARWVISAGRPGGRNFGAGGFPPKTDEQREGESCAVVQAKANFRFPFAVRSSADLQEPKSYDVLAAELQAALAREATCLQEKNELSRRQAMLAEEFEHRLVNGLQLIVSLLSLQSRSAPTPEAAHQLTIAARRVSAIGRVHHRLHLLDHQDRVEFKQYLQRLCEDLSGLLFQDAKWLCHRGRGTERRNSNDACDSAGLYRQRADHKLDEICRRPHHGSDQRDYRRPIVRCRSSMTGRACLPVSRHRTAKGWE